MLRTLIISPDAEMAQRIAHRLGEISNQIHLCRVIDRYQSPPEIARTLRAHAPEVIFLSFENVPKAVETVKHLESLAAGLQIVAINRHCDANLLRETMRAGVREFVVDPFEGSSVIEALRAVKLLLEKNPPTYESTNQILSFLPSKAGVGTTTLAMNVGAALAKGKDGSILLTDLDLNSGLLRILLKLTNENSLVNAVDNAGQMDEMMWPQLVTAKNGMDILHAGRVNPNLRVEPSQIQNLIRFARRNYKALIFDLSGNLERYSLEVMQESRQIFLVCTPEISSLHLAREKMGFLKTLGLDAKVSLLLNRLTKRPLFTGAQVEDLVGAKVAFSFSNDYFAVCRATNAGQCLDLDSVIGKQCAEFAKAMTARRPAQQERRKKFLEFFSVGAPQPISVD